MVIERILKQLTPKKIKEINTEVQSIELSSDIQKWVKDYSKIGAGLRTTDYFWKWIYRTAETVTLPLIENRYKHSLYKIKTLLIMFVVLLDDIFDKNKNRDLGNELLRIPYRQDYNINKKLNVNDKKYYTFTWNVWKYIQNEIEKYPRYVALKDIFEFDIKQILNEMDYAYLVNNNLFLANKTEFYIYFSHNMQAMTDVMLDLMCSHNFDITNLGRIREIAFEAQKMARIGNWVSTWEREVTEKDFTSGVFTEAIDSDVLTIHDLGNLSELDIINKIKSAGIEYELLKEWDQSYRRIEKLGKKINQRGLIDKFLNALEKLIIFHLSSRGYK